MYGLRRAGSLYRTGLATRSLGGRRALTSSFRNLSHTTRSWLHGERSFHKINTTLQACSLQQWRFMSSTNLPPHTLVSLPALSPTMETGTLVKWEKEVGDELEEGDIIAQIETDKATMDMETPTTGYLATIIVAEGTSDIQLGKLLAVIVEDKDAIEAFKDYQPADVAMPTAKTTPQTETPVQSDQATPTSSIDLPPHTRVSLPALSPTMDTGSIVKWEKEVGDELEEGDIIVQIETDKATMDMETPTTGYLATIMVPEGSRDIPLGQLLAVIVENKEDIPAFKEYSPSQSATPPTPSATPTPSEPTPIPPKAVPPPVKPVTPTGGPVGRIIASPYARTLARERGVDLSSVVGTGPGGRIVGKDVPQAGVGVATTTQTTPTYEDIPLTGMRKTIANRLQLSKQTIPHYYLSIDINMEDVIRLRKQINNEEMKLSVNDFIIKAAAMSMKSTPEVNSSFMDTFIRRYDNVDVSIAVSTPGGLITPIVFDADVKGLQVINEEVRSLAERARSGKLKPHEFQGGTFTISNLGMFGIRNFSAVINPPQSCILAVGATEKRLIVDEESPKGFSPAPLMSVTLSCDHRVVDGAIGAQWLTSFKSYLEKPFKMLI